VLESYGIQDATESQSATDLYFCGFFAEMEEHSGDENDEFANVAICICSAAESLTASQDGLAHIQVSIFIVNVHCCC